MRIHRAAKRWIGRNSVVSTMIAAVNAVVYTYGLADFAWDITHDAPILAPVTDTAQAVLPQVSVGWGLGIWGGLSLLAFATLAYVVVITHRSRRSNRIPMFNFIPRGKNRSRGPRPVAIRSKGPMEGVKIRRNVVGPGMDLLSAEGPVKNSEIDENILLGDEASPSPPRRGTRRGWRSKAPEEHP